MAMRPISTDGFTGVLPATSHGPAPQLQWIKVAHLVVDDSYQRPVDSKTSRASIKTIATAFDWRHFAPVVVSPIAGGQYAIVDGQHRTTGAALCGIETVPCLIILADAKEQAAAFYSINGQVTKVGQGQIFKARLKAADPEAIRIDRVAAAAGVRLLYSNQDYGRIKPNETAALAVITALVKTSGDAVVAGRVRMLMPGDLDFEAVCVLARDRIRDLSREVARQRELLGSRLPEGKALRILVEGGPSESACRITVPDGMTFDEAAKRVEAAKRAIGAELAERDRCPFATSTEPS